MAPLPPESTARFYLDYNDGWNDHSMVFRVGAGVTGDMVNSALNEFLSALDDDLYEITIVGLRVSSDNSNVTNPVPWTGPASYGTGTMPAVNRPRELRFQGRSTDGRRVSVSVYGYSGATPETYNIPVAFDAVMAAARAELIEMNGDNIALTISSLVPVWKNYVSFNFNSYWERECRG